jgi:ribosomal protein S18 acetylase RimI-like enzyme
MKITPNLLNDFENNLRGRFSYFQKKLKAMEVVDNDSLLIVNSHTMTDMFNIVCCKGQITKSQVQDVVNIYREGNLPFAWWVGFKGEPDNLTAMLEESGLKKSEEELAMAIELSSSFSFTIPKNLEIRRVKDHQTLQDFVGVITDIVPHEQDAIKNFYLGAEEIICHNNTTIEFYVGYVDSKPTSTCSVFFTDKVAGIFDIIASPKFRGMGIGSAMTHTAMQAALNKGYKVCVLTATDDAKYLYEKISFQSVKSMCVYVSSTGFSKPICSR